jgi:hypothetical protein
LAESPWVHRLRSVRARAIAALGAVGLGVMGNAAWDFLKGP